MRAANERVGGINGCTHLRELLAQMGTVAFQTLYPVRRNRDENRVPGERPAVLGTCLAYAPDSAQVLRMWPEFYTGAAVPAD